MQNNDIPIMGGTDGITGLSVFKLFNHKIEWLTLIQVSCFIER